MPTAYARFGNQLRGVAASYSLSWGVSPSQARVTTGINDVRGSFVDSLTFFFRDAPFFTLRDALVTAPSGDFSTTSTPLLTFTALDRRWKWQYGGLIDGDYNVARPDGTLLREKSPRELATLLFEQLGETGVDVSKLPSAPRPRIVWRAAKPADELSRLCASYGCAVAFDPFADKALIVKIGVGSAPPAESQTSRSNVKVFPPPPDGLRIVGGPTLAQWALAIGEAVGREVDGTYKKLADLSYYPAQGFQYPLDFQDVNTTYVDPVSGNTVYHHELAQSSVFRCYRITGKGPASAVSDLGPFTGNLVDKDPVTGERLPAYARGEFADKGLSFRNRPPGTRYPGSLSIDGDSRIVTFSEPLFLYEDGKIKPARLELVSAFNWSRDGVPVRYEKTRPAGWQTYGAGEEVAIHEDLVLEEIAAEASTGDEDSDNRADLDQQADYYLAAMASLYGLRDAAQTSYGGWGQFAPDGVLRSVSWSCSTRSAPQTTCSWNAEASSSVVPYEQRPAFRQQQIAEAAARRAAANATVAASRAAVKAQVP